MDVAGQVDEWWRWLDAHPEPGWHEVETTAWLTELVGGWGADVSPLRPDTGLVARFGHGERVIGMRADIDAIPFPDGHSRHACGHSAHMAIVLGALRSLLDGGIDDVGARVVALFQPAEEIGDGAGEMIEAGFVDDLDVLFGVHLRPIEELGSGLFAPGLQSGGSKSCLVTITGRDAHGARIHQGDKAVDAIVAIHAMLKSIYPPPWEPWSAKITRIRTGGAALNIIPGSGEVAIDVRGQHNDVLADVCDRIERGLDAVANLCGVGITWQWSGGTPAAEIAPAAQRLLTDAITRVAGADAVRPVIVSPGADDFHVYTQLRPRIRGAMLGVGCDLTPGLHSPETRYDPAPLPVAAEVMAEAVRLAARADLDG